MGLGGPNDVAEGFDDGEPLTGIGLKYTRSAAEVVIGGYRCDVDSGALTQRGGSLCETRLRYYERARHTELFLGANASVPGVEACVIESDGFSGKVHAPEILLHRNGFVVVGCAVIARDQYVPDVSVGEEFGSCVEPLPQRKGWGSIAANPSTRNDCNVG